MTMIEKVRQPLEEKVAKELFDTCKFDYEIELPWDVCLDFAEVAIKAIEEALKE